MHATENLRDTFRAKAERKYVRAIPCPRCHSDGEVCGGTCFLCSGERFREGDPATLRRWAAQARREKSQHTEVTRLTRTLAAKFPPVRDDEEQDYGTAVAGYEKLLADSPERAARALASLRAGHPRVAQALVDYFYDTRNA